MRLGRRDSSALGLAAVGSRGGQGRPVVVRTIRQSRSLVLILRRCFYSNFGSCVRDLSIWGYLPALSASFWQRRRSLSALFHGNYGIFALARWSRPRILRLAYGLCLFLVLHVQCCHEEKVLDFCLIQLSYLWHWAHLLTNQRSRMKAHWQMDSSNSPKHSPDLY